MTVTVPSPTADAPLPLGKAAKSLPELLAERILGEIMAGRIEPGHRLKELALSQQHAVSRATVREALITLAKRGYVEQIPRFGARVAAFAKEDVFDLFEIRAALLSVAARRCALDPDAPRAALAGLVAEMEAMAAAPEVDPQSFSDRSVAAQNLLIGASGNRRLPELYAHLANMSTWRLIRGRATSFLRAERRRESAADWRQLETAIRLGDADTAETAARQLIAHSAAGVRAELQSATPA